MAGMMVRRAMWVRRTRTLAFFVLALLIVASIGVLVSAKPAHADAFSVNSLDDVGDAILGDHRCTTEALPPDVKGICTLRAAIDEANANDASDTITFPSGLSGGTITLTLGQLAIANDVTGPDLTIDGPEGSGLRVSADNNSRVFKINGGSEATITRLAITAGRHTFGGGVFNEGTLTLAKATVSASTAEDTGGGIYNNESTLTLTDSTVSANKSLGGSGGIFNSGGTLTLTNSTVSGNTVVNDSGNNGGGIFSSAGTMSLTNVTVSANKTTDTGGGIYLSNGGTATLVNTIVAGNAAPNDPDASGAFVSDGNNLIGDTRGASGFSPDRQDLQNVDSLLGPLANNGGPTKTHALLQGSPAIDRAANADCPSTDQRGVARQDGDNNGTIRCDIGAFERDAPTITNLMPAQGSSTSDTTPLIAATVNDAQTNLATTNIKLFVDGDRKTTYSYNRTTDRLTYTSEQLSFGRHTVKIVATDGVNTTTRSWRFTVVSG